MILIFSNQEDYSTSKVIKWLCHYDRPFVRLNGTTEVHLSHLEMEHQEAGIFVFQNTSIPINDIHSYWFRRGKIRVKASPYELPKDSAINRFLNQVKGQELRVVEEHLHHLLERKKSLGNLKHNVLNKLHLLDKARQAGLKTPETLITGRKEKLIAFFEKHRHLIVKPLFEIPDFSSQEFALLTYTSPLHKEVLDNLADEFFPSLFQKRIDKKYELRVFYLNGKCYANAIFSQMSQQTDTDSRRYDKEKPNRRVPFNLPDPLIKKIQVLMKSISLNCGSIDLIVSRAKEYIFLEVNPIGQFGMTSYLGNYRLEQKIAKYLADA